MIPASFALFYQDGQLRATWDQTSVPEGFSVLLQFLDADGNPLTEQPTVTYSPGEAVMTGAPTDGEQFHVRAQVLSPYTATQDVTVHTVGPVSNITLDWHAGALHATWTAPTGDGPFTYRTLLLDSANQPVNPQPPITPEGSTGVAIAGESLIDKAQYSLSVQAVQEGSLGPVTTSQPYTIDKSRPDSPLLRALLTRLQEADQGGTNSFDLSPDVVQAPNVTSLFGSLLGQANDTLPVSQTSINYSPTTVGLAVDSVDLPFASGRIATFTFTDVADQIELTMSVADLGSFSVTDLISKRIIPASVFDPATWAAGLASFSSLGLTLDSQAGALSFTNPQETYAWSIDVGLAGVTLGQITPAMQILAPTATTPKQYLPQVSATLTLNGSTTIPVLVQMPAGLDGWMITLGDPSRAWLGDLSNLNALMGGANSGLPADVISIGNFRLTQLRFAFTPSPDTWSMRALLAIGAEGSTQGATWDPLGDGLITIQEITAGIDLTLYNVDSTIHATPSGFINGTFVIKDALTVSVGVVGPDPHGLWSLVGSASLDDFSLSSLASYLGGSAAPLTDALAQLGTIGSLSLSNIVLKFALSGENAGLRSLSVGFAVASWTVPSLSWFAIDQITLALEVQNPTQSDRIVTGRAGGILTLGSVRVAVDVDFSQANTWHLQLAAFAADLSGLDQINDVLPTSTITGFLPSGLNTDTDFGLGGFTMTYNSADGFIAETTFDLAADTEWSWLNGLLTLWSIALHLRATRATKDASYAITGSIGGEVEIGGALFDLLAERQNESDPWSFHGGLAAAYTVDFNEVLQQLGSGLTIPSGYGLPTSITVLVADLTVVPDTGKLDFLSQGTVDWSYDFGQTTVALTALGGELHIPGGSGKTTGALNGNFTIGSLQGLATLDLGETDTVLDVLIGTDLQASAASLVDSVAGTGTYEGVSTPTGFVAPTSFARAGLTVNLTQSSLLLTGEYAGGESPLYAALALLVAKDSNQQWGFVLAGALNHWTLADISPALAGVDQIIGLTSADAAIALSLLDETAGAQIASTVPAIGANMAILPGLNLYARLDFTGGWLANVAQIISLQGPYTISGNIPADETGAVTLNATLGGLRLLNTFAFNGINLTYVRTPAKDQNPATNDLRLTGTIIATLDQEYSFQGDLHVTSSNASFQVATTNSVANPLGIPGITLDGLGFAFSCDFASGQTSNTITTFYGQVSFTSGPTLLGLVGLQNGSATLVLVKLLSPGTNQPAELSIATLFNQVTGLTWPDVLDVKLSNGQLWYVPGQSAVTYQGQSYLAGFHASADVTVFFLPKIKLAVDVYGDGQNKGLTASAQFAAPVDWSFIKFTGTTGHGGATTGPFISIDTRNQSLPFTLGSGINLLGSDVGDVTIQVGKEKMTGTFTLPESAGVFSGASLSFDWDDDGFHVTNWPIQNLDLPKFDLENLKGAGSCSQVIMELLPIDSEFNLDVSFSIQAPQNGGPAMLGITLNGYFDLVVTSSAYKDDPLLRANIVNATTAIPFPSSGGYDWGKLKDGFVQAIKSAGESIIQNLLEDPENVAKLSAVVGAKWAISEAVDYLVCRGMSLEAAEAAVAMAASAEAGTAAVCGGATVALGGVVGTIIGGVFTNQDSPPDPQKPKPQKPGTPTLAFAVDHLAISWSATDPTNTTSYAIALADQNGNRVPVSAVTGTSTTVPASALTMGKSYTARIIANGPGGQSDPSDATSLYLLPAPAAPTLSFTDPTLAVAWDAVPNAQSYAVQVLDANGAPVPNPQIRLAGTRAEVEAQAFEAGGTFTVQVQSIAPSVTSPWGTGAQVAIALLPAPQSLAGSTVGSSVQVTWQAVTGATGYAGSVTDQNGQPVDAIVTITGETASITGAAIVDGAQLKVTIKGTAPNAAGTPSAPLAVTVNLIPTPEITAHLYSATNSTLTVSYTTNAKTASVEVEMRDSNDQPVTPAGIAETDGRAELAVSNLAQGSYTLRVRATAQNDMSDWSQPVTVELLNLPKPSSIVLENAGSVLLASWAPVTGAQSYGAVVLDQHQQPLDPQPAITYDGTTATIISRTFTVGTTYYVQVRAEAPGVEGPYADPVSITWAKLPAWTTLGHDFQRTGRSALVGPDGPAERWSVPIQGWLPASAAVTPDGTIVAPAFDFIFGFNPDGSERWRWSGSGQFNYSPSIGPDGTIYFGSEDKNIYALDAGGQLKWKYTTGSVVRNSPAIAADGTIYAGSYDCNLYALKPDGSLKWSFAGNAPYGWFEATIALAPDGTLYAGAYDNNLYAVGPDGALKWKFGTSGQINTAPTVGSDGTIYVGSWGNTFYAINPNGTLKWQYSMSTRGNLYFSAAALGADGTIYVHYSDDSLYAFAPDGSVKWQTNLGPQNDSQLQCPPAIDATGTIFIGSESGTLYAIAPDGSVKWTRSIGAPLRATPTIGPDQSLYFGGYDQRFHALGPIEITGVTATASVTTSGFAYGIAAGGHYAFVSDMNSGLYAYDVTNRATPRLVQHLGDGAGYRATVMGDSLYVASYIYTDGYQRTGGLRIYDLSKLPGTMTKIGEAAGPGMHGGTPGGVAVGVGTAYVAAAEGGVGVFSLADPTKPELTATIPVGTNDSTYCVVVSNNLVYAGNSLSGLQIYRMDSQRSFTRLGGYGPNYTNVRDIALYEHYALLASYTSAYVGVLVVDVSNPAAPTLVTKFDAPAGVMGITMMGPYAILTGDGLAALVIDFRDPTKPTQVASLPGEGIGWQITRLGASLFAAMGGLKVMQLQTPETL